MKVDTAMASTNMTSVSRRRAVAGLALAVLAVAAIGFPLVFSSPVTTNYAIYALIFVAAVSAWNVFSGFSGYISLGHAVFFGSGAYTVGIAARDWHMNGVEVFVLLPLAAAVGAAIAVPFGLVALRVRRHTFIVITIAVFFIFQLMAYNLNSFTGGTVGVSAPFLPWSPTSFNDHFYYITLACAAGMVVIAALIRRSRFGLQLRAIRDDEDRARGLGVHTMRVKLTAFVLSGAVTALVGGVWFLYLTQAEPNSAFDPLFDLALVLMAFLGGLGTIAGPVLGALIIEPGQLYLNIRFTNGYFSEILLGALFLIIVLFMPRGIVPTVGEWVKRLRTRGRPAVPPESQGAAVPPGRVLSRNPAPGATKERRGKAAPWERPGGERGTQYERAAAHGRDAQGLRRRARTRLLHGRDRRGLGGRPDRAERIGQDHLVQRHHRVRQGGRGAGIPGR